MNGLDATLWTYVAAPALALGALVATLALRLPQLTRLAEGFRAAFTTRLGVEGSMHPSVVVMLSSAAGLGAAAAVGAATAVSLGGAGALAWLWLFGFLLAPLRAAEALLARTSEHGKPANAAARGSLASRMLASSTPAQQFLGNALLVLVPVVAFAWVGGSHGGAVLESGARLLPGSERALGLAVAVAAAAGAYVFFDKRFTSGPALLGWVAAAALLALFGIALVSFIQDPSRSFDVIARAFGDAINGASNVRAFSGALAGEIAIASVVHMLPALAAQSGSEGALHADAQADDTRGQMATALLAPIVQVVIVTLLMVAFIATGAFSHRTDDTRALTELSFWRTDYETVSQRAEADRRWEGMLRVTEGLPRATPLELATERGMISAPRFRQGEEPGDFAARIDGGEVRTLLYPQDDGSLDEVPLSSLREIEVDARMLPRGGGLIAATMERTGGDAAARIALVALLLLAALSAVAFGRAAARTLEAGMPAHLARAALFLPAIGIALRIGASAGWLATLGSVAAALAATVTALAVASAFRELSALQDGNLVVPVAAVAASESSSSRVKSTPKKKKAKAKKRS